MLNNLLADLVVEYHKLQNFHWYVKGSDFFNAHAKLEELYNGINGAIDEVGEHILMIGEKPLASLNEFIKASHIQEADMNFKSSKDIYNEVIQDFDYLLESVKKIKEDADQQNNPLISSLMDNYIGEFSKNLWMLRQAFQ